MEKYTLKSGVVVDVPFPVQQEIVIDNRYILLMMTSGSGTPDDNIICFSGLGISLWTIEPHIPVKGDQNPYMRLSLSNDGELIGHTWAGVHVALDVATGKIKHVINRRPW